MKPLTLEETKLKEEMKERCLAKGHYIDENAKAKFKMLCHLEDFEFQCWELDEENKRLRKTIIHNEKCRRKMQQSLIKQIDDLELQCKKQKEVIDRAIEYIKELNEIVPRYCFTELLDILKEVSE